MYNIDYITSLTREEVISDLKYDINKFDNEDLENLYELWIEEKEILCGIAGNHNTDFSILMSLASMEDEDIFTSLLENEHIWKYRAIAKFILETTKSKVNQYLAYRLLKEIEQYI